MSNIRTDEYAPFRKNLNYIMDDYPSGLDKATLSKVMRERSFHEIKGERCRPTIKQLELAWGYISSKGVTITEIFFRTERYKRHSVRRAMKSIPFKGKTYRKGQFLPKEYK